MCIHGGERFSFGCGTDLSPSFGNSADEKRKAPSTPAVSHSIISMPLDPVARMTMCNSYDGHVDSELQHLLACGQLQGGEESPSFC